MNVALTSFNSLFEIQNLVKPGIPPVYPAAFNSLFEILDEIEREREIRNKLLTFQFSF